MKLRLSRVVLPAAAVSLFVAAVTVFGAATPGYAQRLHPVGLLGARGASGAAVFNALAFVAPGLLLACVAWALRDRAHGWASRIGSQLVLLSALALAAQGLLPLDPTDFDHADSQRHAVAWTAWWLAFAAGCLPIAASGGTPRWLRLCSLGIGVAVPLSALLAASWLPAGIAQRLAYALWFAWWLTAGVFVAAPRGPERFRG